MKPWLRRLMQGGVTPAAGPGRGGATNQPVGGIYRPTRDTGTRGVDPGSGPDGTALGPVVPAGLQRRALLHRHGHLAGFEISWAEDPSCALEPQLAAEGLLQAMGATAASGRLALARLSVQQLSAPGLAERVQPGMMFAVADAGSAFSSEVPWVAAVRSRAGQVGTLGRPRQDAAFVVLDAGDLPMSSVLAWADASHAAAPGCLLVATGLRSIDDLEAALSGPFEMAAGLFDRVSQMQDSAPMTPDLLGLCRLLGRALTEPDTRQLGDDIRADADLSFRLLRHANSPLLGFKRKVESVEQALQVLGLQALSRLLTVLLVVRSRSRTTAMALHELALTRAHFLESHARALTAPAPALYITGLLSLLDVMMQQPMKRILDCISLLEESRDALVHRCGPWHQLLELARCLESGRMSTARELSLPLGGLAVAQAAMEQSRQAAASVTAELRGVWRKS